MPRRRGARLVFGAVLAVMAVLRWLPVQAAPGAWSGGGPAEPVRAVALSPTDEQTLLAAGTSGVWRTTTGGAAWQRVAPTLLGASLAYSLLDPNTVFATSADGKQVLESADGGATWTTSFSVAGEGSVSSVLADPNVASRVFASGTGSDGLAQVWRSLDGGATWSGVLPASLNGAGGLSTPLAGPLGALPGQPGFILAGVTYYHAGGVVSSADGGSTWQLAYNGALSPLAGATSLAVGSSIYAGLNVEAAGSLVRSDDGGATWTNLTPNLPIGGSPSGGVVAAIAVDPAAPETVFIAEWDIASPRHSGVFESVDRGASWTELGHLGPTVSGPDGLVMAPISRTLHAATDAGVFDFTLGTAPPPVQAPVAAAAIGNVP